jgi:hypothetical protein
MLVPALVLAVLFVTLVWRAATPAVSAKRAKKHAAPAAQPRLRHFLVPLGAMTFLFFLAAPFAKARMADFYVGSDSLLASLRSLIDCSFAHNGGGPPLFAAWRVALAVLLPVTALAAAGLGSVQVFRSVRERKEPALPDAVLFLAGGAIAGSAVLLIALHYAAGMPFPSDRTGLYFLPLAGLALAALAKRAGRVPAAAIMILAALIAVHYLFQWNTASFYVWRYDADSKRILDRIENVPRGSAPLRVGVSWQLEPSFNFYRAVRRWSWLAPFGRSGPDGDYHYYVLMAEDRPLVARRALREIYTGPVSGTVLAAPAGGR